VATRIPIDRGALADFCQRRHVRKLSLFGSVIALHDMEEELSRLLGGRRVDLVTERFLNRRIRERVLAGAEVQYAAG
jgi:predicted nucleotidyltransferase